MPTRRVRSLIALTAGALSTTAARGQVAISAEVAPPQIIWETTVSVTTQLEGADEIAVDGQGNAVVLGYLLVERDFYVLKFSPMGSLLWQRTIGGGAQDAATGLAVDDSGDVYVCGNTTSGDFPTVSPYQRVKNGPSDAFLMKLSGADGSTLFSTFFGGSRHEWAHDVAIGPDGSVHITGQTDSLDLEVVNPIQSDLVLTHCFCDDAFVTRFAPTLDSITFSTYLGGAFDDMAREIEVDAAGNIAIAGVSQSSDFPTLNAVQSTPGGGEYDTFVAKIDTTLALDFSTYLGGEDWDVTQGLALDGQGAVYVTGSTRSITYPTTPGAFQELFVGGVSACEVPFGPDLNCYDMYVTKLDASGFLAYSTFIGGHGEDEPRDLVVDEFGRAHVVGYTYSTDFPGDAPFGSVVTLRLGPAGETLQYVVSHDTPGANGGAGVALHERDVFIASSVGLPYDTYVARLGY